MEAGSRACFGGRVSSHRHDVGQKSRLERGELRFRARVRAVSGALGRLGNRGLGGRSCGGFVDVDGGKSRFAAFFARFAAAFGGAARAEVAFASSARAATGGSGQRDCGRLCVFVFVAERFADGVLARSRAALRGLAIRGDVARDGVRDARGEGAQAVVVSVS